MTSRWLLVLVIAVLLPLRGWATVVLGPALPAPGGDTAVVAPCHGTAADASAGAAAPAGMAGAVDGLALADDIDHAAPDCDVCHAPALSAGQRSSAAIRPTDALPVHRAHRHADALGDTLERPPRG